MAKSALKKVRFVVTNVNRSSQKEVISLRELPPSDYPEPDHYHGQHTSITILKITAKLKSLNTALTPGRELLLIIHYLSVIVLGFQFKGFEALGIIAAIAYIITTLYKPQFLPNDKLGHLYWGLIAALVVTGAFAYFKWSFHTELWVNALPIIVIPFCFSWLNEWADKHNGGTRSMKDHIATSLPGIVIYLILIIKHYV